MSLSEEELGRVGPRATKGDYVAATYFQSLSVPQNRDWLKRFEQRYGAGPGDFRVDGIGLCGSTFVGQRRCKAPGSMTCVRSGRR